MEVPAFGAFPIPSAKNFRDAAFSLGAPSTNSSGEFRYSSSDLNTATVSSNGLVTIVGAGSTVLTVTQEAYGNFTARDISGTLVVSPIAPTFGAFTIPSAKNFRDAAFSLGSPTTDSSGAFRYSSSNLNAATVSSNGLVTIVGNGSTVLTVTQDACGNFTARDISGTLVVSPIAPTWTPSLLQDSTTGDVYFANEYGDRFNVYSLTYATSFTLLPNTFTIPSMLPSSGPRDTDVPASILPKRKTLIGFIPLINISSNNNYSDTPIRFSFPTNNYAVSVERFDRDYYVIPQASGDPANSPKPNGLYKNPGAENIRLPYRNALIINGVYDDSGGFRYGQDSTTIRMEMSQAKKTINGVDVFLKKSIFVPLTIIKAATDISLNTPFTGIGRSKSNSIPDSSGNIVREWIDGSVVLNFPDFARTTRKNIYTGEPDYGDIQYYLNVTFPRTFDLSGEYIQISGNRITFKKSTQTTTTQFNPISIKFLQEETSVYKRSNQRIGDMVGYTNTINLIIKKSTPEFANQIPQRNTGDPTTIYRLPDLNKMTSEGSFILIPPETSNKESGGIITFSSSNEYLLSLRVTGTGASTVYTAFMNGSGRATITVTQASTTNFNQKIAIFDVNVFEITPAVINCNTNLFYTNPYNRQFWTRFKPECRSSNLVNSITGLPLTGTQVDEVYDMRRKAEILKYNKNVGGLTKTQKYAKAARGELMRNIGNSTKYTTDTTSPFALICPPSAANNRILCGLTSACGVPGPERLLCYDPSINLYNYKRTYQYEAGDQLTLNIPTTILTEPINLRISKYDNVNKRVTLIWDAPNSNGGLPITGYVITYSTNNKTWKPYKSVFPYKPPSGVVPTFNAVSGEINGNSVVFEKIPGSIEDIIDNTVYYLSVFSGNERGLSSVPATITLKTSSVPSIINDFGFTNTADERENLMVDLKWTDPSNTGNSGVATAAGSISSYNGPPITGYNLYYRKVPETTWTKITLTTSNVIIPSVDSPSRRYILRNLFNESKYQIKIEPINSVGIGPETAIINARTLMKPVAPTNITISSRYGLLPPTITDISRNYINVTWNKPDTGGTIIKYYNITITPPSNIGSVLTYPYNVSSTDTRTSYSENIGILNSNYLVDGSYSIVMETYNGYLTSNESARVLLTINPSSANAAIFNIEGYYTTSGLSYAEMTFSINTQWQISNPILFVRVNGLYASYSTFVSSDNQPIAGSGQHKIRIPVTNAGSEIIVVGTQYSISITLVYQNGQQQTSETFSYTPEIKYLSL